MKVLVWGVKEFMLLPVPHPVNAEGTRLSCVLQEDAEELSKSCGRRRSYGIQSLAEEVTSTALVGLLLALMRAAHSSANLE